MQITTSLHTCGTWPFRSGTTLSPTNHLRKLYGLLLWTSFGIAVFTLPGYAAPFTWQTAVSLALQNHPSVVAAIRAEDTAKRSLAKVNGGLFPQLTFSSKPIAYGSEIVKSTPVDYTRGEASISASLATPIGVGAAAAISHTWNYEKGTPNTSLSVSASAALDTKDILHNTTQLNLSLSRNALEKATWERVAQQHAVAVSTVATFWRLELDARQIAIALDAVQDRSENYNQVLKRQKAGTVSETEALTAQIELLQAEAALSQQEAEYHAKQAAFAVDLGITELPPLVTSGGAKENELIAEYNNSILETAAQANSVLARKRRLDVSQAELELMQAVDSQKPDMSISTNYQITDLSDAGKKGNQPWNVFLNVELPIADGARRKLTVQDKQASLDAALSTLTRELSLAATTITNKLLIWDQARRNVEIARLKLQKAKIDQATKSTQYQAGILSGSAFAAVQRTTQLAEIDLQAAIDAQRIQELEIADLIGGQLLIYGQPLIP